MPHILRLILTVFILAGISYTIITPPLEPPDELLNYANALYIAKNRTLPILQADEKSKAHHPPLYYVISAFIIAPIEDNLDQLAENSNRYFGYETYQPGVDNKRQTLIAPELLTFPWKGATLGIHLLRLLSVLMGVGVITAVWQTASLLTDDRYIITLSSLLVAFNPMFIYIQSSVHNDALTNLLAAMTIWATICYWQQPTLHHAGRLAIIAALGILTKITFLFLGPMIATLMLVRLLQSISHRELGQLPQHIINIMMAAVIVLLLSGWWFLRNITICGTLTCMNLQQKIWQPRPSAPNWEAAWDELGYLFSSFWGVFGFGQITFPSPIYLTCHLIVIIALLGLLRVQWREHDRLLIGLLLIAPLSAFAATFWRMSVSTTANFGRYLFTTYAVIAPLLAWGFIAWLPAMALIKKIATCIIASLLFMLNLYALWGIILPVYTPPLANTIDDLNIMYPVDIEYEGIGRLLGYDISSDTAVLGETVDVTLYWQAMGRTNHNLTQFVQWVDPYFERIGSRDSYHALGRYPSTQWQENDIIIDTIPIKLTQSTKTPTALRLIMGLFDEEENNNRLLATNGEETHILGFMRLKGDQPVPIGHQVNYQFDHGIALIGLTDITKIDDAFDFTMTWQAITAVNEDVTVFVHLIDAAGNLINTSDSPPDHNHFPSTLWQPDDTIIDIRYHSIPPNLPSGHYRLIAGLYRTADLQRLTVRPIMPNEAITLYHWEK